MAVRIHSLLMLLILDYQGMDFVLLLFVYNCCLLL